jgi:hypothetical protein
VVLVVTHHYTPPQIPSLVMLWLIADVVGAQEDNRAVH